MVVVGKVPNIALEKLSTCLSSKSRLNVLFIEENTFLLNY